MRFGGATEGERWGERGKEAACMSTLRERQKGSGEVCDGREENGGDGVHWKRRRRRRRRRGVVLQWREVRGDCSLCLWERLDYVTTALRDCSELEFLILDGPPHEGDNHI